MQFIDHCIENGKQRRYPDSLSHLSKAEKSQRPPVLKTKSQKSKVSCLSTHSQDSNSEEPSVCGLSA